MSRPAENLPGTARSIALLLSATPSVQDAQPGVLHQLLEFSHRYTTQVLTDASVYAEHAGRAGKVELDDVVLAVQARVGWEFGGRVPKEYVLSLATEVNAAPLPAVPEVFGVRLPPASECLTSVDFDLIPNKPPPGVKIYDEEVEEIEESESEEEDDEDADMEPASIPRPQGTNTPATSTMSHEILPEDAPFPISAIATPSDIDMIGTPGGAPPGDTSDVDEDGLFGDGGGDEEEESDGMEEIQTTLGDTATNGLKRKLVEEDDYD
ncbi:transcription initiation factor IID, 31kD subunit-domain-containing protein [Crucibulum laeve]|uniref:Transcription initiation factor IID, 31kD subunit-domain-containing protein n=1 Tax=Crucibulum laeve TaxID=68775 RepID=A0A5C3MFE2_9AGAR|nr:transcription initiation factor IID, 31kD subunit-domain-containing protein [Crucibulum laeve]